MGLEHNRAMFSSTFLSPRMIGVLQVALSATCFGAMAVFAKFAYRDGVDLIALLLIRFGVASLVMIAWMRIWAIRWPAPRMLIVLILMGGIGYVAQSFSFFSALHYASAALVALLLYLHPFIVTLASALIYRTPLTPIRVFCLALALLGAGLVIGSDLSGEALGYIFAVAAAFIYSVYLMIGQQAMRTTEPLAAATVVMAAAAVVFGVLALIEQPAFPATLPAWSATLAIALISTAAAMALLFSGIRTLGAADASVISTLEPVVTAALSALLLGELLAGWQLLGGALVLVAVIGLARYG